MACLFFLSGFAIASPPSYLEQLQHRAQDQHLSESVPWRRLLHDRRTWHGSQRSDIDDASFFASPNGRTNPSAELDATLASFFESVSADTETQHPQCRYPARYAWLNEQLHFDPSQLVPIACPRFEAWAGRMNAGSVTLVFASYYMNNPSSMYGHPFLRLNPADHPNAPPLLDYSVSFAADIPNPNSPLFPFYGLAGVYRGRFTTMPYYMKVRSYSDVESRDLWEYDLSLNRAATTRLVQHLWELGQTSMAYYFFTENCAYEVLPLLEVADPSLDLSSRFRFKSIPADMLRVVRQQPGLVTAVHERPSFVSQIIARRKRLTPDEVHLAEHLATAPILSTATVLTDKTPQRRAYILDSAYDYFRYRAGFARGQPERVNQAEQRLLLARNQVGLVTDEPAKTPEHISPDLGHPSGRIGVLYGFTNRSHFEELDLRPAIQDQSDPPEGYLPGSQLEMLHLRLRYDNDRSTAYVREFSLVNILSLAPLDQWVHHLSWTIKTGLETAEDLSRDPENSLYYGLSFGSGFAFPTPVGQGSIFYGLAKIDSGVGHAFDNRYRVGGGGEAGLLFSIASFWRVQLSAAYTRYPVGNIGGRSTLKLVQGCPLRKNLEARITLERQNNYKEILAGLMLYL